MSTQTHMPLPGQDDIPRLIGRFVGREEGPLIVVTAALHGNEPAGIKAAAKVLDRLREGRIPFRGNMVALIGNTRALKLNTRFVHRDLNRGWTERRADKLREAAIMAELGGEEAELLELLTAIEEETTIARGQVYFVDLHTSSAAGCPFLTCGDTLRNRRFARSFTAPILLGIEEQLDGSLLEFMSNRGYVTAGVEGGQHDLPASVDNHEAALWIALISAGNIAAADLPEVESARQKLHEASRGLPRVMEVRYRHAIHSGQEFEMQSGFSNFQKVKAGEFLARDRQGEIRARETGLILLPLYQGLGEDGFFIGRRVSSGWLALSRLVRWLKVYKLMPWLPGVRHCWEEERTLRINTAVARFFPLQLFHLLGYRKLRRRDRLLLVTRRLFDIR